MANRRMFSKTVVSSSNFLMMPSSSQNLYFHLGMNADDDGFCEHFSIMRMVDAKPDDLKILHAKGFVRVFDDKVLVITEWKENNYLRNDRYTPSKYLAIYKAELHNLASGIPTVDTMDTQVRLGKDRKGKESKEIQSSNGQAVAEVINLFKEVNPAYQRLFKNTTQRKAVEEMIALHGLEMVMKVATFLKQSNSMAYMPRITTPHELHIKWGSLESAVAQYREKKNTKGKTIISST